MSKNICIVGAGFAGIATARTLSRFGHQLTVYEKTGTIGGVWAPSRRYPGVCTQNTVDTYYLSELPMPDDYPTWPDGAQVAAYLESYVDKFDLRSCIKVYTEVVEAHQNEKTGSWTVTTQLVDKDGRPCGEPSILTFDILILCNGVFSDGLIPNYPGRAEFEVGGGKITHSSSILDSEDSRDKHVIVVGYGKSACDVTCALSEAAASTTVVARQLLWKIPKHISGINMRLFFYSRFGENLFKWIRPGIVGKILHGPANRLRSGLLNYIGYLIEYQLGLKELGLYPTVPFEAVAQSSMSLASDHFFDRVRTGSIKVKRECQIKEMKVIDGQPSVVLDDETVLPADLVVCGTGFHQRAPILDPEVTTRFTDAEGNFILYRSIQPLEVSNLFLNGYNATLYCPTSSEVGALWIAGVIEGAVILPPVEERRQDAENYFAWMDKQTAGKHAKGTNISPFGMVYMDDLLKDLHLHLSRATRIMQYLAPIKPKAYSGLVDQLLKRVSSRREGSASA